MGLAPRTQKVSDVATYVKRTFGDESSVQVTDEDIYRWINAAQREILTTNKILKAVGTTDLISGTAEYLFPSQNIQEVQAIHVGGRKIDYRSFQEAEDYIIACDPNRIATGEPTVWYEWGGTFYLYPIPDISVTGGIKIYYVDSPAVVSALGDALSVPDSFFNRVVEFCLGQAYEMDEDSQNSQFKLSQFANGLDAMANQEVSTHADYYPRITILEEDM
jgi:hypothetical protein